MCIYIFAGWTEREERDREREIERERVERERAAKCGTKRAAAQATPSPKSVWSGILGPSVQSIVLRITAVAVAVAVAVVAIAAAVAAAAAAQAAATERTEHRAAHTAECKERKLERNAATAPASGAAAFNED